RASARCSVFFFQAEDGIRDFHVTGVQTCALPISSEQLLARALEDELREARENVVIATKGGLRPVSGGVTRDSSPDFLRDGVDKRSEERRVGKECRARGVPEDSREKATLNRGDGGK